MGYFVGAYWGARDEPKEVCAKRIASFLAYLGQLDVGITDWFQKQRSKSSLPERIQLNSDCIAGCMRENRRDISGDKIPELGFSFGAWTGPRAKIGAEIGITCGAFSVYVKNHAVLSFDEGAKISNDSLRRILQAMVSSFDPEHAIVTSTDDILDIGVAPVWEAPSIFRYDANGCGQ